MQRRDLLIGLAAAAQAAGEGQPAPNETVYIPPAHRVEDLALLHDTMEEFPFVELVTTSPTLRITHLPVWLDRKGGDFGTVYGHIARNNAQTAAIESGSAGVLVYHGPHAYISPTWYENKKAVPTWNFAAVHVHGKLEAVTEEGPFYELLSTLISRSENKYGRSSGYDFSALPRTYTSSLMKNIIGFRLRVESLEGKFKLGQERSEADRNSIVSHLKPGIQERSISEFTAGFYQRTIKPRPTGDD